MKKIFSAALALVCVWFASPVLAACNLFDSSVFNTDVGDEITFKQYQLPNGTYTMSTNFPPQTGSRYTNVWIIAGKQTTGQSSDINGVSSDYPRTITVTDGWYTIFYRSTTASIPRNPKDYNWQLEQGSTATAYQPYNATCDDRCKNLFDKAQTPYNSGMYISSATVGQTGFELSSNSNYNVYRVEIQPSTTYTFGLIKATSPKWVVTDANNVVLDTGANNGGEAGTSITITTGATAKYLYLSVSVNEKYKCIDILQLELGDTATEYVPYNAACHNNKITIATTKYNESAFSPLNTALQNAISVVDTVVSNTITQAGRIATLQTQKQTRPNDIADDSEKCPAGKKCLLVEDASGVPHWYEIVERYSLLPDGYTELEYIESTGTQYIDTGIKSASTIKAEFVVDRPISPASGSVWVPMGTTLDNNGQFSIFESTNGSGDKYVALTYGVVNGSTVDASAGATAFAQSKFVLDGGVLTIDNGVKTITPPQAGTTFSTQNDIWLFLRPNTNVGVGVKMYYCKLWDNGTLVRDFVPAKNSSGVVGMYDTVSGTFFENAGTGEFIAGDPVVE